MAAKIADHYRRNGYFVAQAYLPAQDIKDGAVTIAVIEGRYGKVSLRNQTNLSDGLANGLLGGIEQRRHGRHRAAGEPPAAAVGPSRRERQIDPGARRRGRHIRPARRRRRPGQRVTGSIDADNAGNRYTGEYRVGATVNLNNPPGRGDVASLRVLTSGPGLNYARASYQMQFGKATAGRRLQPRWNTSWARNSTACTPTARPKSPASMAAIR